jgi:hypothetical protein
MEQFTDELYPLLKCPSVGAVAVLQDTGPRPLASSYRPMVIVDRLPMPTLIAHRIALPHFTSSIIQPFCRSTFIS